MRKRDGGVPGVRLLGTLALLAVLALSGCGSGPESASTGSAPAEAPAHPPADAQDAAGAGPVAGEAVPGQPGRDPAAPPDLGVGQRAIVYTGSITVRVADVDAAAASASGIVTGAGGFVGGDNRSSDRSSAEATLQLRVPAERFARVVDEIAGLGHPQRREISTDDVTEETLDLDARIATQRARVASGRRLLAEAKTLSELVMLEGELAKREADLASLEAKKRRLADLTALSTITAVLLGPGAREPAEESGGGFLAGLTDGWRALVASLHVLLTLLGALLPWLVALGLPAAGVLWLLRRRRERRSLPAAAPRQRVPDPAAGTAPAPVHPPTG
ncbi:DUF4349 domain-containing protein [Plantactinospora sp. CA-290183]|uniref:DUF4349 domain-containing protein n=1 Tax=Plantactinospora sp. CA-290183 TaxID=3240006 RepID=UPI003D904364